MRLLLINFEMDSQSMVLAWQLSVAIGLARFCEKVIVLTNRTADFTQPSNMQVYVFPKLLFKAPIRWLGGKWWMNLYVWWMCKKYSLKACFIHMNMEWSYRLWPVFHFLNIPVLLWYAHGTVTPELEKAHHHATRIVTSTPQGFRLPSNKLSIIGQGIDTSLFTIQNNVLNSPDIITVGRISARKRIDLMLETLYALLKLDPSTHFRLIVIGGPLTDEDRIYFQNLMIRANELGISENIQFVGAVPFSNIPNYYHSVFLHLNLSLTGSMDKTVMEALAAGCPVLTSNEAFEDILKEYPQFIVRTEDPKVIASQILDLYRQYKTIDHNALRNLVFGKHDLDGYLSRIIAELEIIQNL